MALVSLAMRKSNVSQGLLRTLTLLNNRSHQAGSPRLRMRTASRLLRSVVSSARDGLQPKSIQSLKTLAGVI